MATSWPEQKADFQQRYETLSSYVQNNLPQDLQTLATSLANYVEKGGVAQDPTQDGDYNNIQALSQRINQNKQRQPCTMRRPPLRHGGNLMNSARSYLTTSHQLRHRQHCSMTKTTIKSRLTLI